MLRSTMYVTMSSGCAARRAGAASEPSSSSGALLNQPRRSRIGKRHRRVDGRRETGDRARVLRGGEEGEAAGRDLAGEREAAIELGEAAQVRVAQAGVEAASIRVGAPSA